MIFSRKCQTLQYRGYFRIEKNGKATPKKRRVTVVAKQLNSYFTIRSADELHFCYENVTTKLKIPFKHIERMWEVDVLGLYGLA